LELELQAFFTISLLFQNVCIAGCSCDAMTRAAADLCERRGKVDEAANLRLEAQYVAAVEALIVVHQPGEELVHPPIRWVHDCSKDTTLDANNQQLPDYTSGDGPPEIPERHTFDGVSPDGRPLVSCYRPPMDQGEDVVIVGDGEVYTVGKFSTNTKEFGAILLPEELGDQLSVSLRVVGLYTLNLVDPLLESAWFQPLNLKCFSPVSNLRFPIQLVPLQRGARGR
jgi:hypothetical protein